MEEKKWPIKGVTTKTKKLIEREVPKMLEGRVYFDKETVERTVDVKTYYTPTHKKYEEVKYNPQEGGRLFDNEEQAIKSGFVKAK